MVRKGSPFFTRALCTQIFVEYVDAYIKTLLTQQYSNQTIMFVMREKGGDTKPAVVPHDVSGFSDKSIESAALHAVSYSGGYELDLILYCQFEAGYKKKNTFTGTFACRDGYGNTVHQMYKFDRKKKSVSPHPIIPLHNKWVPPVGKKERYHDPVLPKIATQYAMILAEQQAFNNKK